RELTVVVVQELLDRLAADEHAVAREATALRRVEARAVRADEDVLAPRPQSQREADDVLAAAECGEPAIAALPPVAVRAVEDRSAVALFESVDRRQVVDHAGGDEQIAPGLLDAVAQADAKAVGLALRRGDADAAELDVVDGQLAASQLVELRRRDAVAGEVAVE